MANQDLSPKQAGVRGGCYGFLAFGILLPLALIIIFVPLMNEDGNHGLLDLLHDLLHKKEFGGLFLLLCLGGGFAGALVGAAFAERNRRTEIKDKLDGMMHEYLAKKMLEEQEKANEEFSTKE